MSEQTKANPDGGGLAAGVGLLVFTLLAWASAPLFLRALGDWGLDAFNNNAWRYLIAMTFWLPVVGWAAWRGRVSAGLVRGAAVVAVFNMLGQTAFAWGPYFLPPGFFSFVFRVQIVFVSAGAYVLFPAERGVIRSRAFWVGTLLVAGGAVGMVLLGRHASDPARPVTGWSVGLALLGGVLFAGYGLAARWCVAKHPPVLTFGVTSVFTACGLVAIAAVSAAAGWSPAGNWRVPVDHFGARENVLLVTSALVAIALSHASYYAAIARLGVARTVGVIQLQPIVTAVASTALFNERLSGWQWACGVIGIAGALVMIRAGETSKEVVAAEET